MKTFTTKRAAMLAAILLMSETIFAQEEKKFELTPEADLVSSYIWRGAYQTGVSIQPSLALSYAGLSLIAWGSTDLSTVADEIRSKEFDLTLGYDIKGLHISVTDYWWSGEGHRYGNYSNSHYFEGTVGYHFGEKLPLCLTWNTMFAGGDKDAKGDAYFSTYIEATYDFSLAGISVTPGVGISPWTGMYSDGFGVCSLSLKARKEIRLFQAFSLPLFTQVIVTPEHDNVFLVLGINL